MTNKMVKFLVVNTDEIRELPASTPCRVYNQVTACSDDVPPRTNLGACAPGAIVTLLGDPLSKYIVVES